MGLLYALLFSCSVFFSVVFVPRRIQYEHTNHTCRIRQVRTSMSRVGMSDNRNTAFTNQSSSSAVNIHMYTYRPIIQLQTEAQLFWFLSCTAYIKTQILNNIYIYIYFNSKIIVDLRWKSWIFSVCAPHHFFLSVSDYPAARFDIGRAESHDYIILQRGLNSCTCKMSPCIRRHG